MIFCTIKNKIGSKIFRINRFVLKRYQYRKILSNWDPLTSELHREYCEFIGNSRNIEYDIIFLEFPNQQEKHKWVGGVLAGNNIFAIPNDSRSFLKIDTIKNETSILDNIKKGEFKWTGGTRYNDCIYAFPRTDNKLLCYNVDNQECKLINIGISYKAEHHYGGVCTADGRIFQPPRNTDHILVIDIKKNKPKKIFISPSKLRRRYRYCGSIIHPNGFIYFFPEKDMPVIKLDPATDRWCFIDKPISTMTFNAKVTGDGNIYGFSAYEHGLMKIDIQRDKVEMIHKEVFAGAYGTKLGLDGCLYSIPGDGKFVWKYRPETDTLIKLFEVKQESNAKYAGGVTMKNGTIYGIPAKSNNILVMNTNDDIEIPDAIFEMYFTDNY